MLWTALGDERPQTKKKLKTNPTMIVTLRITYPPFISALLLEQVSAPGKVVVITKTQTNPRFMSMKYAPESVVKLSWSTILHFTFDHRPA